MTGQRRAVAVVAAGEFTVTAGLTTVVPFLPFHLAELGAGPATRQLWAGVALVAPAAALMLAAPLWGWVGDRLGRRWMLVRALVGLGASLLAMALVTTPAAFVACRLAQGAFGGATDAAAAYLTSELAASQRGRALGYLHSATAAGAFTGPLAGGLLAGAYGYRVLFLSVAAAVLAAAAAAWRLLSERHEPQTMPARRPGFVGVSRLLRHPHTRACLLAGVAINIATYGLITLIGPHVEHIVGDTADATRWVGLLQAATWLVAVLGASWWGRWNDARSPVAGLGAAALACALAVGGQALLLPVPALLVLRVVQGASASAVVPSAYLAAGRLGAGGCEGSYVGSANSMLVGGQIAGGLLAGSVSGLLGIPTTITVLGGVAAVGGAGALGALAVSPRAARTEVVADD
jgi:DHA1 family multidrug resistance protein-like MFS transporter